MNRKTWTLSMYFALAVPSLAAAEPAMGACPGDAGLAEVASFVTDVNSAARLYGLNVMTGTKDEKRAYRKVLDAGTYVALEAPPEELGIDWRLYPAIDISPRLMVLEGTHEDIYVHDGIVFLHSWSDQELTTLPRGWFRID